MKSAVLTWLHENEELAPGQTVFRVRPGKLTQLKNARKKTAQSRGGPMAILAAIVLLSADGEAVLERRPNKAHNRKSWDTWIADATQWMVQQGWLTDSEAERTSEAAKAQHSHHSNAAPTLKILNLGEGWRSVGWKLGQLRGGDVQVTGVDRRDFTYTGTEQGTIIAEVKHNWLDQQTDLLTALSKKASTSVRRWDLVTLEPECTLLSKANARNQSIGAAHGKWAETELNKKNAHPDRLCKERQLYKEALQGIKTQLDTLEANPGVLFTMENPWDSELWQLEATRQAMQRNRDWRLLRIDRCAYGREEQKPTGILTNLRNWRPKGRTGNGQCKAGKCTGWKTATGKTKHPRQTMPESTATAPDRGTCTNGRYQWTAEAVKNALEIELLEEIVKALETTLKEGPVRDRHRSAGGTRTNSTCGNGNE
jgi:hypothetical protein